MLTEADCAQFHRDGFLCLRGILTAEEVEKLHRAASRLTNGPFEARYLYRLPEVEDLWADERFINIARKLLGGPIVYFYSGELHRYNFRKGEAIKARHLHHDAKGTVANIFSRDNRGRTDTYPAIRFGIYLQDTETQSGGLKVAPGSHKRDVSDFQQADFNLINIASRPGDVVVFTHRLLHSPLALRPKDDPQRVLTPNDEDAMWFKTPDKFLPIPQLRDTIFFDFATLDELSDLYIKNRAVQDVKEEDTFSQALIEGGLLKRAPPPGVSLRVDRAIVEVIENTSRGIRDGFVQEEGAAWLRRLPALCQVHFETSAQHPICTSEVPDLSIETALKLYGEIVPNLTKLQIHRRTLVADLHMGPSPTARGRLEAQRQGR